MEIRHNDLTKEHLHNYDRIEAIKYNNSSIALDRIYVWKTARLRPFQGKNVESPERKTLFVRIRSDDDIVSLKEKIEKFPVS